MDLQQGFVFHGPAGLVQSPGHAQGAVQVFAALVQIARHGAQPPQAQPGLGMGGVDLGGHLQIVDAPGQSVAPESRVRVLAQVKAVAQLGILLAPGLVFEAAPVVQLPVSLGPQPAARFLRQVQQGLQGLVEIGGLGPARDHLVVQGSGADDAVARPAGTSGQQEYSSENGQDQDDGRGENSTVQLHDAHAPCLKPVVTNTLCGNGGTPRR